MRRGKELGKRPSRRVRFPIPSPDDTRGSALNRPGIQSGEGASERTQMSWHQLQGFPSPRGFFGAISWLESPGNPTTSWTGSRWTSTGPPQWKAQRSDPKPQLALPRQDSTVDLYTAVGRKCIESSYHRSLRGLQRCAWRSTLLPIQPLGYGPDPTEDDLPHAGTRGLLSKACLCTAQGGGTVAAAFDNLSPGFACGY
jgi:hypothetical protein